MITAAEQHLDFCVQQNVMFSFNIQENMKHYNKIITANSAQGHSDIQLTFCSTFSERREAMILWSTELFYVFHCLDPDRVIMLYDV